MLANLNMYGAREWWGGGGGGEGGDRGAGARENRGGGKRAGSGSRNKESNSLLFIAGHYLIKNTYLAKF